jgi:hypothetical protein
MNEPVTNLLYESLETEIGGVQVYTQAIECARNSELKKEWRKYLEQTKRHEEILREVFETLGLDAEKETPGRLVVRHIGESLVQAMNVARQKAEPGVAEIVAAECIVLAETKDHLNWELIGESAGRSEGEEKKMLSDAHGEVESEEDEHLYHTQGWTRELWMKSLGFPAVLPPPEEKLHVKTAIGAALAKKARKTMPHSSKRNGRTPAKRGNGRKSPARPRASARRRQPAKAASARRAAR